MKTIRRKIRSSRKVQEAGAAPVAKSVLTEALLHFIEYHPAARVNRNIRKMVFEFLQCPGAIESLYLKDLLYDLEGLFELLDEIHESQT